VSWIESAACIGRGDVMWGEDVEAARAICATCPVRAECLAFALDTEPSYGVFGGRTWPERVGTCPICQGPKRPEDLGCTPAHSLLRRARLVQLAEMGDPDVMPAPRSIPTARTGQDCPNPRGQNHSSAGAYRRGCRCDASREALRLERSPDRPGRSRGRYGPRAAKPRATEGAEC